MQQEGQKEQNGTVVGPQWQFKPEEPIASRATPAGTPKLNAEVAWTASEYVAHQKTPGWFALLGIGAIVAAALVFLVTQDWFSSVMIVVVAAMFGIFAARQPKVLSYQLTHSGIQIGEKFYSYDEFKSFSVLDEGAISSILLMPMKRFMPGLSMYYPPEQEEKIVYVIANYLPHEDRDLDRIDRLMHKVRF